MNEIGVDWTSLISVFWVCRVLLGLLGAAILYDYICLVGFVDGPRVSFCFKMMLVWMGTASAGLLLFSLAGDLKWMLIFSTLTIAGYSLLRLWTWLKGVYLSEIAAGKTESAV